MTTYLWHPRSETGDFHRLGRLMDAMLTTTLAPVNGSGPAAWSPALDLTEDAEAYRLVAELPGVAPADVSVTVEHQVLTLKGEKKAAPAEAGQGWHRSERRWGRFERRVTLPRAVDAERITATFEAGVLTVVAPKAERAKARAVPIATA
ncbi:MAG: Hsp20/alpha crystallin family protein [Gemmatimonadales bacterium]|nr:Hsp20/alpha crystallin family protein [Gemmatimonadales bacterium]